MDGGGSRSPGAEHLCQGAGPVAAGAGPVPGVGAGCELPMSAVPEPQPVHEGEEVGSRREPTRDGWDAVQGAVARVRVLTGSAYPTPEASPRPRLLRPSQRLLQAQTSPWPGTLYSLELGGQLPSFHRHYTLLKLPPGFITKR